MKLSLRFGLILLLSLMICVGTRADPTGDLILAAGHGEVSSVQALLNQGADVNAADEFGITALMYAAHSGSTPTVKLLLDKGANVNAKAKLFGYTALMNAAGFGDLEMVQALLDKGARVNEKNSDGATALKIAEEAGKADNVTLLRHHGAN